MPTMSRCRVGLSLGLILLVAGWSPHSSAPIRAASLTGSSAISPTPIAAPAGVATTAHRAAAPALAAHLPVVATPAPSPPLEPRRGADGIGSAARFYSPWGVALSADGRFALVADTNNSTVRRVELATGQVTTVAGVAGQPGRADGVGAAARFNAPWGVALSADGRLALVTDGHDHDVRRLDVATALVMLWAGSPGSTGT